MEMRIENEGNKFLNKMKKNPWMLVSIVLVILLVFPFASDYTKKGKTVDNAIEFINSELLQGQGTVELNQVNSEGDFYEIIVDYEGRQIPTYFTKDGNYFVNGQLIPMAEVEQTSTPTQTPTNVPKSDKPIVELFVWSYCPYGVQAQTPFAEVAGLLGDKADFRVKLYYDGHGAFETQENKIQACIQKYSKDKYWDYTIKFVESIYPKCGQSSDVDCDKQEAVALMKQLSIDSNKIMKCVEDEGDTLFAADSQRASSVGVTGSPSLVINNVKVNSARTAEAYKQAVCSAFNTAPDKCLEELSETVGTASGSC